MLFHFFTSLVDQYSFFNVFKYLTFRTGLSVMTSLMIVFIIEDFTEENLRENSESLVQLTIE